jgi:hypothetical protein
MRQAQTEQPHLLLKVHSLLKEPVELAERLVELEEAEEAEAVGFQFLQMPSDKMGRMVVTEELLDPVVVMPRHRLRLPLVRAALVEEAEEAVVF